MNASKAFLLPIYIFSHFVIEKIKFCIKLLTGVASFLLSIWLPNCSNITYVGCVLDTCDTI
jgi:hypothetical protein